MRFSGIIVCLAACLLPACSPRVDFSAFTVPEIDGLETTCEAVRNGGEWEIALSVRNNAGGPQSFKLALAAEPASR